MTPTQSFREPTANQPSTPEISLRLPIDIAIGSATAPLLTALLVGRTLARSLMQLGLSSEELFRGDRLPPLPLLKSPDQITR